MAVVAGPDINPIVFLAEAAGTISEAICPDGLDASCDKAHKAVPTVMVSMLVATLLVGAVLPGTAIGAGLYVSALALPGIAVLLMDRSSRF